MFTEKRKKKLKQKSHQGESKKGRYVYPDGQRHQYNIMRKICQSSRFNDEKCFQDTAVFQLYARADGRKWTLRSNLHYQTDSADLTDSKFQKNKIVLVALRSNALHVEWMYFTCVKKKL